MIKQSPFKKLDTTLWERQGKQTEIRQVISESVSLGEQAMRLLKKWKMSTGSFERKAVVFFIFLTVVFQAEQEKLEVKTEFKINHSKYVLEASV